MGYWRYIGEDERVREDVGGGLLLRDYNHLLSLVSRKPSRSSEVVYVLAVTSLLLS